MDVDTLDGIKTAWEAAAQIHPSGEPHCLLIGVTDGAMAEWTVLTYVEVEGLNDPVLLSIASHAMSHLVNEPMPLWIAHCGVTFALSDEADFSAYAPGSLQDAAKAGDMMVRELLTITAIDPEGVVSQHYTRPLNERLGEPMRGQHLGYVTDVIGTMWISLSRRHV